MTVMTAARPRVGMTDLDLDSVRHYFRVSDGRREICSARSADGVWSFERGDGNHTLWTVTHLPTGRELPGEVSLPKARMATFDGWALRELDRLDAMAARLSCVFRSEFTGQILGCPEPVPGGQTHCPRHTLVGAR